MKKVKKAAVIVVILVTTLLLLFGNSSTFINIAPVSRLLNHITAGFSIDSIARVDNAARLGVNTAIRYGTAFTPADPVGAEMLSKGMHEIDAGFASQLFYYECHRTHTIAPPPPGVPNSYCSTDVNPSINSEAALLAAIDAKLQADAHNPLIVGYWVLDDWPSWDEGSARIVLQAIHSRIQQYTPFYPTICGFGFTVTVSAIPIEESRLARNYSNAGCDMVGLYAYVATHPQQMDGARFDFSMKSTLGSAFKALQQQGWNIQQVPLIGIGQAFAGSYAKTRYEPGITSKQMNTQARAFCSVGAISIGWYGWDDSGFDDQTLTPMNDTQIQQGIMSSIATCQSLWGKSSYTFKTAPIS